MMKNEIHNLPRILVVGFVFFMQCMQTILLVSSASPELVSNKTIIRCTETERNALLDIKRGFVDVHGRLSSWGSTHKDENCCKWSGVGCDHNTGHVTDLHLSHLDYNTNEYGSSNISYSLLHLRNLKYLDLSQNTFDDPIPSFIGSLTDLVHLNLSGSDFRGVIPDELGNLTKLNHLDLSSNKLESSSIPKFIASFTSLTYLDLSNMGLSGAIPHEFGNLTKLNHLDLSSNNLESSSIPKFIASFTGLTYLALSNIGLSGAIPYEFGNLSKLHYLDLSTNMLQSRIPNSLGVMTGITHLDLSANQLEGLIPKSFRNLSSLQTVDFSNNNLDGNLQDILYLLPEATLQDVWISENQLTGSLPDITRFSFLKILEVASNQLNGNLPKKFEHGSVLQSLDLSNNGLQGSLPNFTRFSFLESLYLNDNKFSGSLPDFTGCLSLQILLLNRNQFTDWKTQSIGQLTNLSELDLSMNSINSTIDEHHLSKLYSLKRMNASFNSLTFSMSSEWLPPFNLDQLSLASCKLGPKFPTWIRNQTEILSLDFSNNRISDTIPMWFWDFSTQMKKLDLSSNKINGTLSSVQLYIKEIDLSSNYFEGPLPFISPECTEINLSHNKFSGILLSASDRMGWRFLDLSHNLLYGEIPDGWIHFRDLMFLDLGHNKFSGRIPVSIGDLISLRTLILRNNSLYGKLPESLRTCTYLGFVDIGFNNLSGTVPAWIGRDLSRLNALVLKSNKLYGNMPYDLCLLSHLHFLDLSMNRLSGNVPQCLSNLTAMIEIGTGPIEDNNTGFHTWNFVRDPTYTLGERPGQCSSLIYTSCINSLTFSYPDDALAGWKGKEREYRRNFNSLKLIDLSSNKFTGEIPIGITRLLDLRGLNLSRNKFYGKVPLQIGKLHQLEVLDLSNNKFSGLIPQSMSGLNFLSYLDLSSNNFSGRIPSGSQLQTFNSSMYEGNAGLCGFPLAKRCPGDEPNVEVQPSSTRNEVEENDIVYERGLYISAALGFSTSFWGICVTLLLKRRWRHAYFLFLTSLKDQLYVFMLVLIARLKARLQG